MSSSGSGSDPFAWLGLLQWSLKYSDGTHPTNDIITPMSDEDKAFLEMVMKEGIINENERMKTILYEVTQQIEIWKTQQQSNCTNSTDDNDDGNNAATAAVTTPPPVVVVKAVNNNDDEAIIDHMYNLLQELRDIVEQIDYARAFMSMKGIVFLLGMIENKENISIPIQIRQLSCAIIATLCQHNPPVQKECIEVGAIKILYNILLYQSTTITVQQQQQQQQQQKNRSSTITPTTTTIVHDAYLFCERIIQAISAIVRSYDITESIFCQLEQANDIFRLGFVGAAVMGNDTAATVTTTADDNNNNSVLPSPPPFNVQKRTLFFLRALLTSDTTSIQRIQLFQSHIIYVIDHIILIQQPPPPPPLPNKKEESNHDNDLIEMALGMIQQLLEQRVSVNAILIRKQPLAAKAVQRISILRKIQQQNEESREGNFMVELELWERILSLLADAKIDPPLPPMNE